MQGQVEPVLLFFYLTKKQIFLSVGIAKRGLKNLPLIAISNH
jgi:hypothetical protein